MRKLEHRLVYIMHTEKKQKNNEEKQSLRKMHMYIYIALLDL